MKKLALLLALITIASCAHKKAVEKTPAPVPAPAAAPAAIESEPVAVEPEVAVPATDQAAEEILSYGLNELNAKGYLKQVFFDYDQSSIKPEYRDALEANARFLARNPSLRILIEGHCDERGTREYNIALGERRASEARQYLSSLGIDTERIQALSYGREKPFAACAAESCWSQNRRAHFVIVAK